MSDWSRISASPELNVGVFSFLLNFVWEMWQVPFLADMPEGSHWLGVAICTRATIGDAFISIVAFWVVAMLAGARHWVLHPRARQVATFIGVGILITIVFEALATGPLNRWAYAPSMPTLPILGTGLFPLFQWILLPPIILWFVKRQLT